MLFDLNVKDFFFIHVCTVIVYTGRTRCVQIYGYVQDIERVTLCFIPAKNNRSHSDQCLVII